MARRLFLRMALRKFSEITNNQSIFSQYNTFYNYGYFFFFSRHFGLFSIIAKEVNQIRNNVGCVVARLVSLFYCAHSLRAVAMFSTYFRKLKEIEVLRPKFPDYVFMEHASSFLNLFLPDTY